MRRLKRIFAWLGLTVEPDARVQALQTQLTQTQADLARLRGDADTLLAVRLTVIAELRAEICGLEHDLAAERDNVRERDRKIAKLNSALAVAQLSIEGRVDPEEAR